MATATATAFGETSVILQPNPPSPAFTNPDLILPSDAHTEPASLSRRQPPSPPDSDQALGISTWIRKTQVRGGAAMHLEPNAIRTRNPPSPARHADDSIAPAGAMHASYDRADAIASSPIIKEEGVNHHAPTTGSKPAFERRWSDGSGSIHSDDIENMRWPDFDGPLDSDADEESFMLEIEEQFGEEELANSEDGDGSSTVGNNAVRHTEDLEQEPLSRRADIILANAKKRLQAMEGNLRGARNSILLSGSSSPSAFSPHQTLSGHDRPQYITPAETHGYRLRRLNMPSQASGSHGDARKHCAMSDSPSADGPQPNSRRGSVLGLNIPKRSSSAMGSFARGLNSLDGATALRGSLSQQNLRDSRLQSWIEQSAMSGQQSLPDTPNSHTRSSSTASATMAPAASFALRDQMDELKGRISSLKTKTQDDQARRLSLGSDVSVPSNTVESWHTSLDVHRNGFDGIPRWTPNGSPSAFRYSRTFHSPRLSDDESRSTRSRGPTDRGSAHVEGYFEDTEEVLGNILEEPEDEESRPSSKNGLAQAASGLALQLEHREAVTHSQREYQGDEYNPVLSPDNSITGESEYFEALPMIAERHEDRVDAFDYESFFLHSAMGSYTRSRNSSSSSSTTSSSDDSVETTRPVAKSLEINGHASHASEDDLPDGRPAQPRRSYSMESCSSDATFCTATQGSDSDSEDGQDPLDTVTSQFLPAPVSSSTRTPPARFVDSAMQMSPGPRSGPRIDQPQARDHEELAASLLASLLGLRDSADVTRKQDVQLVEGVLGGLAEVVSRLAEQSQDYDRRQWRRRLDAACRALSEDVG